MKRKKILNCVVLSSLDNPVLIYRWFRRRYFQRIFNKLFGKLGTQEIPLS
ncbi:MAG: hypothetical protein HY714_04115 [Candidatus Omnitrophica bacterium]|nr:hypothetical protein [Candidatus Omnitrophota bacterium]